MITKQINDRLHKVWITVFEEENKLTIPLLNAWQMFKWGMSMGGVLLSSSSTFLKFLFRRKLQEIDN